ncbi:C2 domain-containing protein 5 like protein, partial [Aduncisulcus paluster]
LQGIVGFINLTITLEDRAEEDVLSSLRYFPSSSLPSTSTGRVPSSTILSMPLLPPISPNNVLVISSPYPPLHTHIHSLLDFVEELVVVEDPEFLWGDTFRAATNTNAKREHVLTQAIIELRRQVCSRTYRIGANAILGYDISVDAMGKPGRAFIVVRCRGTAVLLKEDPHWRDFSSSPCSLHDGSVITPDVIYRQTYTLPHQTISSQRHSAMTKDAQSLGYDERHDTGVIDVLTELTDIKGHLPPLVFTLHALHSLSDISPLSYIGCILSSCCVEELKYTSTQQTRLALDSVWVSVRGEIKKNVRDMGGSCVGGYSEGVAVARDIGIFLAYGSVVAVKKKRRKKRYLDQIDIDKDMTDAISSSKRLGSSPHASEREGTYDHYHQPTSTFMYTTTGSSHPLPPCSILHSPHAQSTHGHSRCMHCREGFVPPLLLTTVSPPPSLLPLFMPLNSSGHKSIPLCVRQVRRIDEFTQKEGDHGGKCAVAIAHAFPFIQHLLHEELVRRLVFLGLNCVFRYSIRVSLSNTFIVSTATGDGMLCRALPPPPRLASPSELSKHPSISLLMTELKRMQRVFFKERLEYWKKIDGSASKYSILSHEELEEEDIRCVTECFSKKQNRKVEEEKLQGRISEEEEAEQEEDIGDGITESDELTAMAQDDDILDIEVSGDSPNHGIKSRHYKLEDDEEDSKSGIIITIKDENDEESSSSSSSSHSDKVYQYAQRTGAVISPVPLHISNPRHIQALMDIVLPPPTVHIQGLYIGYGEKEPKYKVISHKVLRDPPSTVSQSQLMPQTRLDAPSSPMSVESVDPLDDVKGKDITFAPWLDQACDCPNCCSLGAPGHHPWVEGALECADVIVPVQDDKESDESFTESSSSSSSLLSLLSSTYTQMLRACVFQTKDGHNSTLYIGIPRLIPIRNAHNIDHESFLISVEGGCVCDFRSTTIQHIFYEETTHPSTDAKVSCIPREDIKCLDKSANGLDSTQEGVKKTVEFKIREPLCEGPKDKESVSSQVDDMASKHDIENDSASDPSVGPDQVPKTEFSDVTCLPFIPGKHIIQYIAHETFVLIREITPVKTGLFPKIWSWIRSKVGPLLGSSNSNSSVRLNSSSRIRGIRSGVSTKPHVTAKPKQSSSTADEETDVCNDIVHVWNEACSEALGIMRARANVVNADAVVSYNIKPIHAYADKNSVYLLLLVTGNSVNCIDKPDEDEFDGDF